MGRNRKSIKHLSTTPAFHNILSQMGESSTDQYSSIMKKSLSFPSYSSSHDQESGWTKYFEDFPQEENEEFSDHGPCGGSSSMASDAASSVGWKLNCRVQSSSALLPAPDQRFRKSSFKKRSGGVLGDDPLEDTASSPVNSPKISDLQKKGMKVIRKDDDRSNGQEVGSGSCSKSQAELERDELGLVGNDCTELKKRGLCLVPLSMLVNFLQ
ncbi:hypothetical protein ACLOJK_029485 [Asimina triloba]